MCDGELNVETECMLRGGVLNMYVCIEHRASREMYATGVLMGR